MTTKLNISAGLKLVFFISPCVMNAQPTFQRTYQRPGAGCNAYSLCKTLEGGYAFAGADNGYLAGGNITFTKVNGIGEVVFARSYEPSEFDAAYSIAQFPDSGFLLTGEGYNMGLGGADMFILRTDKDGNALWKGVHGTGAGDSGLDAIPTVDGGALAVGFSGNDGFIVRVGTGGQVDWSVVVSDLPITKLRSVCAAADGGYWITGSTAPSAQGDEALVLLRMDDEGQVTWQKRYTMETPLVGHEIVHAANGGCWVVGTASLPSGPCAFLLKAASDGQLEWYRIYGAPNGGATGESAHSVAETLDGGCVLAGTTASFPTATDMLMLKFDPSGALQWARRMGTFLDEYGAAITTGHNGGYLVCGTQVGGIPQAVLSHSDETGLTGCNEADITQNMELQEELLTQLVVTVVQSDVGSSILGSAELVPYNASSNVLCIQTSIPPVLNPSLAEPGFRILRQEGTLRIEPTLHDGAYTVQLIDLGGSIIQQEWVANGVLSMNLDGIANGIYAAHILCSNRQLTLRFGKLE